ncbi:metallophosphoesterase family protein [Thermanaerosceptrum fracticalcis]|uniref:metallophosphoesterase family protein n=1 Tax=Thermanaerosceptrum fracticalcis TaxID=1712410 RepID=UPI000551B58B|nr:DNA repair exonuclease [Thermanaerosceptrum fracticalcis]
MKPVKILHCADFHFDTPFRELSGTVAEKRKEDLRETFGRVVNLARQERVDIMLLCGDLFDNQMVSRMTIDYLISKLREIPEVRVFISPGNHDPYNENSYYQLVQWPENIHIFKNTLEKVEIQELNTCVYGRGFIRPHQQDSLLKGFSVDDSTKLNIMTLHGDVVQPGQCSDYNPITPEEIKESRLDYLALGHRHSYTNIAKMDDTSWAYCGCPEGRAFDELGDKGILLGELRKGSCNVVFKSISKRKYFELKIDISSCKTYEEIGVSTLEKASVLEPGKNLFKVILQGEIPEDFMLNTSVIKEKLEDQFYFLKVEDETTTRVDSELLANDFTLRGVFVKKMLEQIRQTQDQADRRKAELALKYGLRILEQGEAGIE